MQRGLIGNILNRFERKGLKVVGLKLMELSDEILDDHYSHLSDKPFFPRIKSFMRSTPVIAICLEGFEVVGTVRTLCGITNSREAASGSIRGDLGMSIQCNLVHASDSSETAEVEVPRFFTAEELTDYESVTDTVIYASDER